MAFTNLWDITAPPDTQAANLLGLDIRNLKIDVMQRMSALAGTHANRPAPETVNANWAGLIYFEIDTFKWFQFDGAAWQDISGDLPPASQLAPVASPVVITGAGPVLGNTLVATGPNSAVWGAAGASGYKYENTDLAVVSGDGSLSPTQIYSFTINANELGVNQVLRLKLFGFFSNPAANETYTLTLAFDAVTLTVVTISAVTPIFDNGTAATWELEFNVIASVGGVGGIIKTGQHFSPAVFNPPSDYSIFATIPNAAVDLTVGHNLTLSLATTSGNVGNTWQKRMATLERLG